MLDDSDPITLNDIIEGAENLGGGTLSAPLVAYDEFGTLRYVTQWDVHTVEEDVDEDDNHSPFGSRVTASRLVFRFGDAADV